MLNKQGHDLPFEEPLLLVLTEAEVELSFPAAAAQGAPSPPVAVPWVGQSDHIVLGQQLGGSPRLAHPSKQARYHLYTAGQVQQQLELPDRNKSRDHLSCLSQRHLQDSPRGKMAHVQMIQKLISNATWNTCDSDFLVKKNAPIWPVVAQFEHKASVIKSGGRRFKSYQDQIMFSLLCRDNISLLGQGKARN